MFEKPKNKFFEVAVMTLFVAGLAISVRSFAGGDLDDVEADVDSVMAESDAAHQEAIDAKKRAKEEKSNLKKAKVEANQKKNEASAREGEAKKEIGKLDANIRANQKERAQYENEKAIAIQKIEATNKRVKAKRDELTKMNAEVAASKAEKDAQLNILAQSTKEQQTLESSIVADKKERAQNIADIAELKKKYVLLNENLERLRVAAHKESDLKAKAQAERDQQKRKVSSVPSKVLVRTPKFDCDVTAEASDGAAKVGTIKKGARYDLYRVMNKRWVELQYGDHTAFAAKTCF